MCEKCITNQPAEKEEEREPTQEEIARAVEEIQLGQMAREKRQKLAEQSFQTWLMASMGILESES